MKETTKFTYNKPLKVITVPEDESTLRMQSQDIAPEQIQSAEFQAFLDDLMETMLTTEMDKGWEPAGLSAIQVGVPINVFIAREYTPLGGGEYKFFINPQLKLMGEKTDVSEEACMSIPKTTGPVRRHKRVRIKFYDRFGVRQTNKASGFTARVIQHEYDHLQGILFTDKLEGE